MVDDDWWMILIGGERVERAGVVCMVLVVQTRTQGAQTLRSPLLEYGMYVEKHVAGKTSEGSRFGSALGRADRQVDQPPAAFCPSH